MILSSTSIKQILIQQYSLNNSYFMQENAINWSMSIAIQTQLLHLPISFSTITGILMLDFVLFLLISGQFPN